MKLSSMQAAILDYLKKKKKASGFIFEMVSPEQKSPKTSHEAVSRNSQLSQVPSPDMEEVQKLNFLPFLKRNS